MSLTPLLLIHIGLYLPTSRHHSLMCSSGSKGYHALKEMLLWPEPGNTFLIESCHLREVGVTGVNTQSVHEQQGEDKEVERLKRGGECCLIYKSFRDDYSPIHEQIPHHITHIAVYGNVTFLPAVFGGFAQIQSIDLRALTQLIDTEESFLVGCKNLKSIDLGVFSKVTRLEDMFLEGCSGLKSIDLSPLTEVKTVGMSVLSRCKALRHVDLSPLSKVEKAPCFLLERCRGLRSVNLGIFTNMTDSGSLGGLLTNCSSLKEIDLSPLSNVTMLEFSFLADCRSLRSIDLSPLSNVRELGTSFLSGCSGLLSIDLSPLSAHITTVRTEFLLGCTGLTSVDLAAFSRVTSIEASFMAECSGLTLIDLRPLSNAVVDRTLGGCIGLVAVDLTPITWEDGGEE